MSARPCSTLTMEMVNDENCAPEENGYRESNLMLLTKSRRADIAELQETLHTVKPEQDPFWEARGKERTEKLVHNSVTEAIKARAKSRLYESTTAHKASTRVKAYDEKEYAGRREIPEASNESTVSEWNGFCLSSTLYLCLVRRHLIVWSQQSSLTKFSDFHFTPKSDYCCISF